MEPKAAAQNRASTTVADVKPPVVSSEREKEKSEDVEEPKATAQNQAGAVAAANPPVVASKEREREKVGGEGTPAPSVSTAGTINFSLPDALRVQRGERIDFFERSDEDDKSKPGISQIGALFNPNCIYIQTPSFWDGSRIGTGYSSARCTILKLGRFHIDISSEITDSGGSPALLSDRDQRVGGSALFELGKGISIGPDAGLIQRLGPDESSPRPHAGVGVQIRW